MEIGTFVGSAGSCSVFTHECIAHLSPAAVGECAFPTYVANAFAVARDDRTAMRSFAKLL